MPISTTPSTSIRCRGLFPTFSDSFSAKADFFLQVLYLRFSHLCFHVRTPSNFICTMFLDHFLSDFLFITITHTTIVIDYPLRFVLLGPLCPLSCDVLLQPPLTIVCFSNIYPSTLTLENININQNITSSIIEPTSLPQHLFQHQQQALQLMLY